MSEQSVNMIALDHVLELLATELTRGMDVNMYFKSYARTVLAKKRMGLLDPVRGYTNLKHMGSHSYAGFPERENPNHYNITV